MKSKKTAILMVIVLLFLGFRIGSCVQLATSQEQVIELQEEYDKVNAQLKTSQTQLVELQDEIKELKERYEIVGETPAETAENVVKRYHETHIYSEYDFFVCSDMALDVWDMLKAQGIDALIQIGNVETGAKDITEANHAWILAEVSPGQYLALETTGGYAVWDNPLYYRGWSFDNPREYKRFVELRHEYNFRLGMIKQLTDEARKTYEELEREHNYYSQWEKLGRYNELSELVSEQGHRLERIVSEMKGLFD